MLRLAAVVTCLAASAQAFAPIHAGAMRSPVTTARTSSDTRSSSSVVLASGGGEAVDVPDMERRVLMNWILVLGGVGPVVGALGIPYALFFLPPVKSGGGGGVTARDALGNNVKVAAWTKAHPYGDRALVEGLKGDAFYLITKEAGGIEDYAINAVCTHLGCVVPWNKANNKYMCPCHGSQYSPTGQVVRGPAPLSLALAHVTDPSKTDDDVVLTPWTETDFRNGNAPWWK